MLVHIVSSEYQRVVDYFEPHIALDFVQLCL